MAIARGCKPLAFGLRVFESHRPQLRLDYKEHKQMANANIKWTIGPLDDLEETREIQIGKKAYNVDEKTACLVHAILLLMEATNDKDFS